MQRKERNADKAIDSRFAAMQLINDPQAFAELLFGKLQVGHMSYDTKMLCILMMCRIIGMHQLIMLNVYPFLQRYIQPSQLEVRIDSSSARRRAAPRDGVETDDAHRRVECRRRTPASTHVNIDGVGNL